MTTLLEALSFVKEVAVILGATVAAYVGLRGLSTWNRQLKGGVEYDLARRVLRSAYRLRECVREARSPAVFGRPDPFVGDKQFQAETSADHVFAEASLAYKNRCSRIADSVSELQAELLEAEVLWGRQLREISFPLIDLQSRLTRRIQAYLVAINPNESRQTRDVARNIINGSPEIMYDMSIVEEPDPFWSELSCSVEKLENALRPHLRK